MAPPDKNSPSNTDSSELARVAVKPAPFWQKDPETWFLQLEAQFKLGAVTQDETKFYTTISAIDTSILQSVRDVIANPPAENKYETLKQRLISLFAESEATRLNHLLQDTQLGDSRPSQLLAKMRDLAGSNFGDAALKSLWINRLPGQTQAILAVSSEPLSKLAQMADKIHELSSPMFQVQAVKQETQPSVTMQQQIDALSQQIAELSTSFRQRDRKGAFWRKRSRSPSSHRTAGKSKVCFYHTRFGDAARQCRKPCSYISQGN